MKKIDYNRFPTSGLLWQYKPFILKEAEKYTRRYFPRYRSNMFETVLDHAMYLAAIAEKKFDPSRGNDFSTPLRHWLKGLNRFCKKEFRNRRHEGPSPLFDVRVGGPFDRYWSSRSQPFRRRITWSNHIPALLDLDRHQKNSLRLTEKAVLDWMIEPDGRTLSQVAAWVGCSKGYASKVRYRLLKKSYTRKVSTSRCHI